MKTKLSRLLIIILLISSTAFSQGLSWNRVFLPTSLDFRAVSFVNQNTGFILGKVSGTDTLFKTTNAGTNFERIPLPYELNNLQFLNGDFGFGVGNSGNVFKSVNGGMNWLQINLGNIYGYNTLYIFDTNKIFVAGTSIFYTTNSGANWTLGTSGAAFGMVLSFDFKDSLNGIACGRRDSLGLKAATIFRTTNGGVNWTREYFTGYTEFKKVKYINNNLIYVYGSVTPTSFDVFGKSTDGGNTWTFVDQTPSSLYESIQILDENNAWKFKRTGQIFKSTDGCLSWTREDSTAVTLWSSSFTSLTNGWAVGNPGAIFHYTYSTGITNEAGLTTDYSLGQNYPNPFNPTTRIDFTLPSIAFVSLKIYDIAGKKLVEILNDFKPAGKHSVYFDGSGLPSGVYFYEMIASDGIKNYSAKRKMVLIK